MSQTIVATMARLLCEKDAAFVLGVSPRTMQNWRLRGGGPIYRKVGSRCLYVPDDLRAFVDAAARTSTSEVA